MQSNAFRIIAALLLVAAAVVLFVVLQDDDSDSDVTTTATSTGSTTQSVPSEQAEGEVIEIKGGAPIGGPAEIEVEKGSEARIVVRSDVEGDVHVHGYEITKPVEAGGQVNVAFSADIDGVFEIELHQHGAGEIPLGELRVNP